jgi:hypothetical protein
LLPEAQIRVSEKKVWTTPNMKCDNLRKDLDFKPRYTMESGLTHHLDFVRQAAGATARERIAVKERSGSLFPSIR